MIDYQHRFNPFEENRQIDEHTCSDSRKLQNVRPNYYRLMSYVQDQSNDSWVILELKKQIRYALDGNSLSSIIPIFRIATYLDAGLKSFSSITNHLLLEIRKKEVHDGLPILASYDVIHQSNRSHSHASIYSAEHPSATKKKDDPFGDGKVIYHAEEMTKGLDRQIQLCDSSAVDEDDDNALTF